MSDHYRMGQDNTDENMHLHTHVDADGNVHTHVHSHEYSDYDHEHMHSHGDGHTHDHVHDYEHHHDHEHHHEHTHTHDHEHHEHDHAHEHLQCGGVEGFVTHANEKPLEYNKAIVNRLSRIIGHTEAIKRMVMENRDPSEILIQIASVKSALNNTGKVLLQDHIEGRVNEAINDKDVSKLDELYRAIDMFVK